MTDCNESEPPSKRLRSQEPTWYPSFTRLEIWVMNTEYRLFGPDGPQVKREATHHSRLDEMAKCLGVAPGHAAVRFFWADAVVSVEGPDLGEWQRWVGKRAPSEQQMVKFLLPNIEAAWRGETRTRTFEEAKSLWYTHGNWDEPALACAETGGQPTPGIFVHRSPQLEDEEWFDLPESAPVAKDWSSFSWPTRPTRESATRFLRDLRSNPWNHIRTLSDPSEAAMGVLLDVAGANVRFLAQSPLGGRGASDGGSSEPEACVTVLGGPKGISQPMKEAISDTFKAAGTPLVKMCLGPCEEMAHACVAFLRLQDDAGLFRATAVDLLRTGHDGYQELLESVEAAARKACVAKYSSL